MMRFTVDYNNRHVSVYCDYYSRIGAPKEPYWEMYPRTYADGFSGSPYEDVRRFPLNDTEALVRNIDAELNGEECHE